MQVQLHFRGLDAEEMRTMAERIGSSRWDTDSWARITPDGGAHFMLITPWMDAKEADRVLVGDDERTDR